MPNDPSEPASSTNTSSGGGGSTSVFMLPLLFLAGLRKAFITNKTIK